MKHKIKMISLALVAILLTGGYALAEDSIGVRLQDTVKAEVEAKGDEKDPAQIYFEDMIEKTTVDKDSQGEMEIHFIDVGQGNATLIKQSGRYMLIDAGDNNKGTFIQNYLIKQGVESLDYLILTHPHADHIGGADVIVTKFPCEKVIMTDATADTETYRDLMSALTYRSIAATKPVVGDVYSLGEATFQIIAPNREYKDDLNNGSVGLILTYGDRKFVFIGDGCADSETDMVQGDINIDADVALIGHHGSNTATTINYLNAVTPTDVVISCGEYNDYGHPHAEALNNLRIMGIRVRRTDEQGSVVLTTDGNSIQWNCSPSDSWKVGQ